MGIHTIKPLNFGFIILAPEHNIGRIKTTLRSVKNHYPGVSAICVVGKDTTSAEVEELKQACPTVKGKDTITSLLNVGMKKGHKEWNFFVMEGACVRSSIVNKYSRFIENEKDVVFAIVMDYDRENKPIKIYSTFEEATLNGLFIHQKTFKETGEFSDNPLNISKQFWGLQASDIGVKFKAILGAKVI